MPAEKVASAQTRRDCFTCPGKQDIKINNKVRDYTSMSAEIARSIVASAVSKLTHEQQVARGRSTDRSKK